MGLLTRAAIFIFTIAFTYAFYAFHIGGDQFVLLSDALATIYSCIAVASGIVCAHRYRKSHYQKAFLLLTAGMSFWALAEIIWFFTSPSSYMMVETLRFLGYIPFTVGFFYILKITDSEYRSSKKYVLSILGIFLLFSIIYLNIIPIFFQGQTVWDSLTINGYIVADFSILFGIKLLLGASLISRGGYLSRVWVLFALSFFSILIFDLYFAANFGSYYFGHMSEVFWLLNYVFAAFGFLYAINLLGRYNQFLSSLREGSLSRLVLRKKKKVHFLLIYSLIMTSITFFEMSSQFSHRGQENPYNDLDNLLPNLGAEDFLFEASRIWTNAETKDQAPSARISYRDDYVLEFDKGVKDILISRYKEGGPEDLYCLMGSLVGNVYVVSSVEEERVIGKEYGQIIFEHDPPCQKIGSIGSLHTHPKEGGCEPSKDDLFTFGEMKDPEPQINVIQCEKDLFYAIKMPEASKALDLRGLRVK